MLENIKLLAVKKHLSDHNAEIIAWVIACDGCISLVKTKTRNGFILHPRIDITNTNPLFIKKIIQIIGCRSYPLTRKKSNWKLGWRVVTQKLSDVKYLLEKIENFLPIKQKQAKLLLEFCNIRTKNFGKSYTTREIEIFEEMRRLNKRGRK